MQSWQSSGACMHRRHAIEGVYKCGTGLYRAYEAREKTQFLLAAYCRCRCEHVEQARQLSLQCCRRHLLEASCLSDARPLFLYQHGIRGHIWLHIGSRQEQIDAAACRPSCRSAGSHLCALQLHHQLHRFLVLVHALRHVHLRRRSLRHACDVRVSRFSAALPWVLAARSPKVNAMKGASTTDQRCSHCACTRD